GLAVESSRISSQGGDAVRDDPSVDNRPSRPCRLLRICSHKRRASIGTRGRGVIMRFVHPALPALAIVLTLLAAAPGLAVVPRPGSAPTSMSDRGLQLEYLPAARRLHLLDQRGHQLER